jgi:hypothetical protein
MSATLQSVPNWAEIGRLEILGRLTDIGRVLHLPDAEILLASTSPSELAAFCSRYNQSTQWVVFGNLDEMIAGRYERINEKQKGWTAGV